MYCNCRQVFRSVRIAVSIFVGRAQFALRSYRRDEGRSRTAVVVCMCSIAPDKTSHPTLLSHARTPTADTLTPWRRTEWPLTLASLARTRHRLCAYIKFLVPRKTLKPPRNIADTSSLGALYNRSTRPRASFMARYGIGWVQILRWIVAINPERKKSFARWVRATLPKHRRWAQRSSPRICENRGGKETKRKCASLLSSDVA